MNVAQSYFFGFWVNSLRHINSTYHVKDNRRKQENRENADQKKLTRINKVTLTKHLFLIPNIKPKLSLNPILNLFYHYTIREIYPK